MRIIKPLFHTLFIPCLVAVVGHAAEAKADPAGQEPSIVETIDVEPVWAAHPVAFSLLTHAPFQFVAYYDAARQLTIARRKLDERTWSFTKLPLTTGWDSHNYVTLTVDDGGFLHLSGDMHRSRLNYFRSTKPLDPSTFEKMPSMVGVTEDHSTYPKFLRGPANELIFTYRDGGSGDGNQIFNVYEPVSKTWKRLLDQPLIDGEGKRNAYLDGPILGPDGWFHLSWVWRETPDAATNHDLSYARSKDLRHWESATGVPLPLPIRFDPMTTVDPVPEKGGIININIRLGFDDQNRVTISYHKYDAEKILQPWTARLENAGWKLYQITRWNTAIEFGGFGSLGFPVRIGPVSRAADGRLYQTWTDPESASGLWILDPKNLAAVEILKRDPWPVALNKPEGVFPGLLPRFANDSGKSDRPGVRYLLRWETLSANRDKPRPPPLPGPSMLRVHAVTDSFAVPSPAR